MSALKVGIVSISDRASGGVYKDEGIPALGMAGQAWRAAHSSAAIHGEQPLSVHASELVD
jgi:molybdopterin biosynthesis enzyme MoaB